MNLINAIKRKDIEIEKIKIENNQLNNKLKIVNDQCNSYKNISDNINKPYAYLVKNLQDKNMEILELNKNISDKEKNINMLKQQCDLYENKINELKNDLAMIINNREQINNLENLLEKATNNDKGKSINNNEINRLNYFLNNFNKSISINNNME